LTNSPAYLGYVGFAGGLPAWLFTLYGGVIADRVSRRTMLIITQIVMMVLAVILAGLVFLGKVQAWHIVVLAALLGVANAFDAPARQAFVVELVEREDLTNAIALNSTMFNAATVVGPAVAGLTYAAFGPGWCFVINALSFLAVLAALLMMRVKPIVQPVKRPSALSELRAGLHYVAVTPAVMWLIVSIGVMGMFGWSLTTLLPDWSVKILHGDVTTNGLLLSARGLGALIGALMIAAISSRNFKGKIWTIGSLTLPVMMLFFAQARALPVALFFFGIVGWSYIIQANTANAIVQMEVPDELRGRVMSLYTLVFFGGLPLGSLLVGLVATYLGEPGALWINAIALAIFAVFVWFRLPNIRQIP
jgi:MFS family permease